MKKPRKKRERTKKAYAADSRTLLRFAASPGFILAFLMILVFLGAGAGLAEGSVGVAHLRVAVLARTWVAVGSAAESTTLALALALA